MTFPYGTVLRDSTDGEVVMVISQATNIRVAFFDVLVLVQSGEADAVFSPGRLAYRAVDLPQWERLP